jgi:hypothetical protein
MISCLYILEMKTFAFTFCEWFESRGCGNSKLHEKCIIWTQKYSWILKKQMNYEIFPWWRKFCIANFLCSQIVRISEFSEWSQTITLCSRSIRSISHFTVLQWGKMENASESGMNSWHCWHQWWGESFPACSRISSRWINLCIKWSKECVFIIKYSHKSNYDGLKYPVFCKKHIYEFSSQTSLVSHSCFPPNNDTTGWSSFLWSSSILGCL